MVSLDPQIVAMLRAIRHQESGGNYQARSKDGGMGAYQFTNTWKPWSQKYLGVANAPMTVVNQNKVAYARISEMKNKGYNPAQIAAAWNAGEGKVKNDAWKKMVGVNKFGIKYNVPRYVKNVYAMYKQNAMKMKLNG